MPRSRVLKYLKGGAADAHDFGVVSHAVIASASRHGVSPTAHNFQPLNRCIDSAIAHAVEAFTNKSLTQVSEQAEELGMFARDPQRRFQRAGRI